jgi:hypothetical protein
MGAWRPLSVVRNEFLYKNIFFMCDTCKHLSMQPIFTWCYGLVLHCCFL